MFLLFRVFVVLVSATHLSVSADIVYYLQCLLEEKSEPCEILTDESFSRNVSLLSPRLIREMYKLDEDFVEAIKTHNFSGLDVKSLQPVPAGMMLMLPVSHLSSIKSTVMGSLITQWQTNKVVFKHLVKSIFFSRQVDVLFEKLLSYDFSDDNLRWIAEVISLNEFPEAKNLIGKLPLLFYSPPEYVLQNGKYEKFYLLSILNKPEQFKSVCSNDCLLRFWAYSMIKNNFPEPLENWIQVYTDRWGYVLTGSTIEELHRLSGNSFDDLSEIFSYPFSPIQVRLLYDNFYKNKTLYKRKYGELPQAVSKLLPHQLVSLPYETIFDGLTELPQSSHPSALQVLEMIAAKNLKKSKFNISSYSVNRLIYALPLESFTQLINQYTSVSSILQIQSKSLTKSQLYFLSNGGSIFNFKSQDIFKYSELLRVLPTTDIMYNHSASHVLLHVMANADPYNVPQVYALFNKLWPEFSSVSGFEEIFRNDHPVTILEYFPSRYIVKSEEEFLKLMQGENLKNLPNMFVISLSKQFKESESNFRFINVNESCSFLYYSLSCEDISLLDPYYFTYIMSQFNKYRIDSGKVFPKHLQNCCINKLIELIELKSLLFRGYSKESKLSLLNEAEIDAIGGYIFSSLPVQSIRKSRNARAIIKSIGALSSYELLSAASLTQLKKLSSVLVEAIGPDETINSLLFDLGNLTLFLENQFIVQIDEEYFKLLLESNYIDHRLCANQGTRLVWYNLIKNSFGDPSNWSYQTLISLGDFLIVVPLSDLDKINEKAWIYAADVIKTKYYDSQDLTSDKKFYEVCLSQLPDNERDIYTSELKKLITTLVHASQLQLDTVVSASTLFKRMEGNESESIFSFIDSKREIKLSFSSEKAIIDNSTDSMSKYSSTTPTQHIDQSTQEVHQIFESPSSILDVYSVRNDAVFTGLDIFKQLNASNSFNSESNHSLPFTKPPYQTGNYTNVPWSVETSPNKSAFYHLSTLSGTSPSSVTFNEQEISSSTSSGTSPSSVTFNEQEISSSTSSGTSPSSVTFNEQEISSSTSSGTSPSSVTFNEQEISSSTSSGTSPSSVTFNEQEISSSTSSGTSPLSVTLNDKDINVSTSSDKSSLSVSFNEQEQNISNSLDTSPISFTFNEPEINRSTSSGTSPSSVTLNEEDINVSTSSDKSSLSVSFNEQENISNSLDTSPISVMFNEHELNVSTTLDTSPKILTSNGQERYVSTSLDNNPKIDTFNEQGRKLSTSLDTFNISVIVNEQDRNMTKSNYSEIVSESIVKTTQNMHVSLLHEDTLNFSLSNTYTNSLQQDLLSSLPPTSSVFANSGLDNFSLDKLKMNSSSQINDTDLYGFKNIQDLSGNSSKRIHSETNITSLEKKHNENIQLIIQYKKSNDSNNNLLTDNEVTSSPQNIMGSFPSFHKITTHTVPLSFFDITKLDPQISPMSQTYNKNGDFPTPNETIPSFQSITAAGLSLSTSTINNITFQSNMIPSLSNQNQDESPLKPALFAEKNISFSHHTDALFQSSITPIKSISFYNYHTTGFHRVLSNVTEISHIPLNYNKLSENFTKNFTEISHSTFRPLTYQTTDDNVKSWQHLYTEENNINSNIANLLDTNSKFITEFIDTNGNLNKLSFLDKKYSLIRDQDSKELENTKPIKNKMEKSQAKNKKIKLISKKRFAEIKPYNSHNKRSIKKWSCTALKMVGKPTEIILNESVINSLDDKDLVNCIDLFSEMDLSKALQSLIWRRIRLKNLVLAGKLVAACNLSDIESINFSIDFPWSLEKIFLLGKYNTDEDVRQHVVKEVWKNSLKPFSVELVVSLGSLVCELPEINSKVIEPNVLLKSSVVLGKALPCNFTCLSKLAHIAAQPDAFNDPTKWTFGDVYDLGVIVSGLNINGWKKLISKNHEALSGLSEAAFECLPYKHIKMMKKIDENVLPLAISNKLEIEMNKKLKEFNFFPSSPSEVSSIGVSTNVFFFEKNLVIFCFVTLSVTNALL